MITETGVISENGVVKGQIQLVTSGEQKRVQLYTPCGYFVCEAPYTGDEERGYEQGQTLYIGYHAGWVNADSCFSRSINKAISEKQPLEI